MPPSIRLPLRHIGGILSNAAKTLGSALWRWIRHAAGAVYRTLVLRPASWLEHVALVTLHYVLWALVFAAVVAAVATALYLLALGVPALCERRQRVRRVAARWDEEAERERRRQEARMRTGAAEREEERRRAERRRREMDEERRRREEQREWEERRRWEEQRRQDEQRRWEEQRKREERARREKERMRRDEEQGAKRAEYVQQQQQAECRAAYKKWVSRRPSTVEDRRRVEDIPEPPAWPCDDPGCADRRLKACKHSLHRLYRAWGSAYFEILKKERLYWHPDNFEPFEESKQTVKEKVTEMFQIINSLYEAEQR